MKTGKQEEDKRMSEQKNMNEWNETTNENGQMDRAGNGTETVNYEYDANYSATSNVQEAPKERVVLGIIGAFAGTLIGAVCIVLLGQWGYIASISGVIMGFCALKGYQILGKGFSVKAIVICAVLMIVMVYLSNWATYALLVAEVYEVDAITSFMSVPMLLSEGAIDSGMYYKDLGMIYLFTALGAVPTLKDHFKR